MQKQLVTIFLISFATLAVIHILALRLFLYWRHEWFDMPMHLFGGAVVALGVFAARELKLPFFNGEITFQKTLAFVFFTAVLWEIFEFAGGITVMQDAFVLDTATDILIGLAGGSIGFAVGKNIMQYDV